MKKSSSAESSRTSTETTSNYLLRGAAIVAVVWIHISSSLPASSFIDLASRPYFVGLDQLSRFCVPLFVALSGYGVWHKYSKSGIVWGSFVWKQAVKLLPLYVLASLIFFATYPLFESWKSWNTWPTLFHDLLTGRVDYHLYFVPMIFQFYVLSPLFFLLMKRAPKVTLLLCGLFQAWLYLQYSSPTQSAFFQEYLQTDYQQYHWFYSWMFYFVFGMYLDQVLSFVRKAIWMQGAIIALGVGGWAFATYSALSTMSGGLDPIIALRFTRLPILLAMITIIPSLVLLSQHAAKHATRLFTPLAITGKYSYSIYLFHTLFLRIWFKLFPI